MRVLLGCSMGGMGHLLPLLAVAAALRDQDHEVCLLVAPSLASAAERAGVPVLAGAQPPEEVVQEIWARVRRGPPEQVAGLIDRELFAGLAADAMRAGARRAFDTFAPELALREPCEYATASEAHRRSVPQAQIGISAAGIEAAVLDAVAADLDRRCPGVAGAIRAAPYLTAFPAPLDPSPWPDTRRYRTAAPAAASLPVSWPGLEDRPLVYVTFGSVLGHLAEAHAVFAAALAAVGELPVRALMTVGNAFDPAALGPPAPNVRVRSWVPQADALAVADLVLCHGGSGTTNGALEAGLPVVICPLFADQVANGATVARAGAGRVVRSRDDPGGLLQSLGADDVATIADAVRACLTEPCYRRAAQGLAAQIAGAPTLARRVAELTV